MSIAGLEGGEGVLPQRTPDGSGVERVEPCPDEVPEAKDAVCTDLGVSDALTRTLPKDLLVESAAIAACAGHRSCARRSSHSAISHCFSV